MAACGTAWATSPEDVTDAKNGLGSALLLAGKPEEAAALFKEILARDARNWMVECNLANALLRQGKGQEAAEHFDKALQINPDLPATRHDLANLLARQGHVERAIALYQEALEAQPDFQTYCDLAVVLEKARDDPTR